MKKVNSKNFLFVPAIGIVLLISLVIFYLLMQPPLGDLQHMAAFLSVTALISILTGYGAYRFNWLVSAPSLLPLGDVTIMEPLVPVEVATEERDGSVQSTARASQRIAAAPAPATALLLLRRTLER